ncbi:hypothetical protein [Flavobacterium hungaricum]|nr:hypothetical protein [Flavobacterium hungaricum]
MLLLIIYCCNSSDYCINGNWKIVNSEIFTTSDLNEKEQFYKSCLNKNIVIKEDKIYFPQPDNCFDLKTDIQILKKKVCQMKELPINNLERLSTSLGWKNDSISKNKKIEYFEGILDSKKEENKILIFKINASEIAIYQDPYFLILKKE